MAGFAQHHDPRVADAVEQNVKIAVVHERPAERRDLLAVA
jgi:hypothetical protein